MPRKADAPPLTSAQALFVLEKLLDERKVTAADVRRVLGQMWSEMNALERRLAELRAAAEPIRHPVRAMRQAATKAKKTIRKAVSPERRASMKIQGRYLGLLRKSRKSDRPRFQRIAKEQGREKAIAAMEAAFAK